MAHQLWAISSKYSEHRGQGPEMTHRTGLSLVLSQGHELSLHPDTILVKSWRDPSRNGKQNFEHKMIEYLLEKKHLHQRRQDCLFTEN
jgi:hypothetical protein